MNNAQLPRLLATGIIAMDERYLLLLLAVLACCRAARAVAAGGSDCGVYGWSIPAPPQGAKLLQTHAIIR